MKLLNICVPSINKVSIFDEVDPTVPLEVAAYFCVVSQLTDWFWVELRVMNVV